MEGVINSDGSVRHDNGDGTYTEYGTGGDVTVYTNAGDVVDTAVTDPTSTSYDPTQDPNSDQYGYGRFTGADGTSTTTVSVSDKIIGGALITTAVVLLYSAFKHN
jgi:hypothetical protein